MFKQKDQIESSHHPQTQSKIIYWGKESKKYLKLFYYIIMHKEENDIATDISSRVHQDIIHISKFLLLPIGVLEILSLQSKIGFLK